MKNKEDLNQPLDQNIFIRFFHLHCFVHMFKVFRCQNASQVFSMPKFQLFKPIRRLFSSKTTKNSLFKNLLFTYKEEILIGMLITFIFASLNLLVPQLIRNFLNFMQNINTKKSKNQPTTYFTQQFILLQLLRVIFGEHSKRLFHELAIKVESSLSKKLIQKSLRMAKQITDRIPQSQIYQLQNVDLKLIFNLFKNMYIIFEAPFTVLVALGMIFFESATSGVIAIYWFLIAFFLQRELDGKMMHCNLTKLGLIDQRSKVNYELMKKIKSAKLAGCESLLTQKNNQFFIEENHDHHLFYNYMTLYDITLLMLPIMVVVSISLFDMYEENPITIQEVYVMLSLLQICYNPMKSVNTISIMFHDGLHSLDRLTTYFTLPDQITGALINKGQKEGMLHIKKNTIAAYPHSSYDFWLVINCQIEVGPKQRLYVAGKKGQGSSSFIHMLVGNMKKIKGSVFLNGRIAYLPQKYTFSSATVKENMAFYNKTIEDENIAEIYDKLGLKNEIKVVDGLMLQMSDEAYFTPSQYQKIALGRIFCSNADIYILDNPFSHLSQQSANIVNQMLREKQAEGKLVIIAMKNIDFVLGEDHVLILDEGVSVEYDTYNKLKNKQKSKVKLFLKKKEQDRKQLKRKVIGRFQNRVHRAVSYHRVIQKLANHGQVSNTEEHVDDQVSVKSGTSATSGGTGATTNNLQKFNNLVRLNLQAKNKKKNANHWEYFLKFLIKFLKAASPSQTIFIYLIIVAAEILHIFIHFFIGHQYEEHQTNNLSSFRTLMITQLILTIGLAGILYLEGQVSSKLAIMKGNNLYSESITKLTNKSMVWFLQQFSIKIADKFNHDYEQIFIAWHNILSIYKNIVILIATIFFVSSNKVNVIIITFFIAIIYCSIFFFLRTIQSKVVKHYYKYKYQFVKIFVESIQSAETIKIFDVKNQFINKAKQKYTKLAAYKLAESYTSYGQELLCDLVSIGLLGFAFQYGFQMKLHGKGTAVIATTIFLLMNLSEVLKKIVKLAVNLQSFFALNLEPFMEMAITEQVQALNQKIKTRISTQNSIQKQEPPNTFSQIMTGLVNRRKSSTEKTSYNIIFKNVVFDYYMSLGRVIDIENNPFTLEISQGQKILLLEKNDIARQYLVYSMTKNLPQFKRPYQEGEGYIEIGGQKINDLSTDDLRNTIGIITEENFFFTGTLRENIAWNVPNFDEFQATLFAKELELDRDLQNYEQHMLDSKIEAVEGNINSELNKKIALLRILCTKPKIVIIKDTPSFLGEHSIVQIIENHLPKCTIIKISDKIEVSFDMSIIVFMQNLKIKEKGVKEDLLQLSYSLVGQLLKQSNISGYLYTNMANVSPRKYKSRSIMLAFE